MKVRVVAHDPSWCVAYQREAKRIRGALGRIVVELHHIGSTAIPGILAKPIIDLCLEVCDTRQLDGANSAMEALGYAARGEFGIPGRRLFLRDNASGIRTHHVHAFETGSPEVRRHVAFRDYMIAHPNAAEAYSRLKGQLARDHANDREAYIAGKEPFIEQYQARALVIEQYQARALVWSDLQGL